MKEEDYILFEAYLAGELSAEENTVFKNRLETEDAFQESFNTYKELSGFLEHKFKNEEETEAFKSNLKSISNTHFRATKNTSEEKKKDSSFHLLKYAIAACVVLMFGIVTFNKMNQPAYSDYNEHGIIDLTVRGGNIGLLIKTTKAFNNKEYEKASGYLEDLLQEEPDNKEYQLYYAVTNLELDKFEISQPILLDLAKSNSAYKNKATWYLALSNFKQEKEEESIKWLKQIPEGADDYRQAQQLLNKLE
ncbi:tetratricopeptide repeat protein [Lacinutrix sp. MEBiC02404]